MRPEPSEGWLSGPCQCANCLGWGLCCCPLGETRRGMAVPPQRLPRRWARRASARSRSRPRPRCSRPARRGRGAPSGTRPALWSQAPRHPRGRGALRPLVRLPAALPAGGRSRRPAPRTGRTAGTADRAGRDHSPTSSGTDGRRPCSCGSYPRARAFARVFTVVRSGRGRHHVVRACPCRDALLDSVTPRVRRPPGM